MALAYYGFRISEHISQTPEGFLICRHVPIARTGEQEYAAREMGLDSEDMINVMRPPEEVFSEAAIASFEGKPITDGHPPVTITAENYASYAKGHVQNVRRGEGEESDLLIADMVINDPYLIDRIKNGLRECSCGYDCLYADNGSGYQQQSIRGNHVAVVEAGRAGDRVAIKDASPAYLKTERRSNHMAMKPKGKSAGNVGKLLSVTAKDADPEVVAEVVEALVEQTEPQLDEATPSTQSPPAADEGEDVLAQILARIGGLTQEISELKSCMGNPRVDSEPDSLDTLVDEAASEEKEADEEIPATDESETLPSTDSESEVVSSDEEPAPATSTDARYIKAAVAAIKPIIAKLPAAERRAAADAAAKMLRRTMGMGNKSKPKTSYGALNQRRADAVRSQRATDARDADPRQLGRDIMAKYNPHYKVK